MNAKPIPAARPELSPGRHSASDTEETADIAAQSHRTHLNRSQPRGRHAWAWTVAAAGLALATPSRAAQIGVNFVYGGSGVNDTATNALLATDFAGPLPDYFQANWNNLGRYGKNDAGEFSLKDSVGAVTGITIWWDATGTWSMSGGGTPNIQATADGNLMNSFLDSNGSANVPLTNGVTIYGQNNNNKPMVYLSGLRTWLATQGASYYDVVIYADGDTSGRVGEYWLVDVSGPATNLTFKADVTTHVFICDMGNFTATLTYSQVPWTIAGGRVSQQGNSQGNFAVFTSLTNDAVLLRTSEYNSRSPINALQIIPRTTALPALIDPLPAVQTYAGGTAKFSAAVAGILPMSFQWQKNGVNLADGGNVSGSTNASLTLRDVSAADAGSYTLVVSNAIGTVTSMAAPLAVTSPTGGSYAEKVFTNKPVAYWRLNDIVDPSTNYAVAVDSVGGFNGTYGTAAANGYAGVAGPRPATYPGFESGNSALQSTLNAAHSWVMAPPLNLNTNTVTITAWIYPTAFSEAGFTGLVFERNGSDTSGLGYQNNNQLGYTWNGAAATYNFVSGMVIPSNIWSFVALVVTPSNATLYLDHVNGQFLAVNNVSNTVAGFTGPTLIGDDPSTLATPQNRAFSGLIDEVAVFDYAMDPLEVQNLFKKGLGLTAIVPVITAQPQPLALYAGRPAQFSGAASGDPPISYQWRKNGVNLSDGAGISGTATRFLTISNVATADLGSYDVVARNPVGSTPSSAATLTVVSSNSTPVVYESTLRTLNPIAYWRLNETSGVTAFDYWGGNIATNSDTVALGVAGPQPPDFVGFESTNTGAYYNGTDASTSTSASLINNRAKFSIVGWFNPAGPIGARVGLFGQNDVAEFGFHAVDASGLAQFGIYTPAGSAFISQTNITPGQWYCAAAVGDGTAVNLYLFTTGAVVQATTSATTANYGSSLYPFRIGGGGILDVTGNFFNGWIDEVAVFDRALSATELSTLVGAGISGGALAPTITAQPISATLYAGRTAQFKVSAVGTTPVFRWRKNGVAISDGGNVSGATTTTLTITNASAANLGDYDLVINNSVGTATSTVATLKVITPAPGSYEETLINYKPLAYYRLNETSGTAAYDYWGGFNGVYQAAATMGVPGPINPPFVGFDTNNKAVQTAILTASSYVTVPFGSLSTNTVTITAWVYPIGLQETWAGLLINRNSGATGGMGYNATNMLAYTWNNNNINTYNFVSDLTIPTNLWSFVAVVVYPNQAILYMNNANGQRSATNAIAHTADVFGNNWQIGHDNNANSDNGARNYNGIIDEVAVFTYSLTPAQIQRLYLNGVSGAPVTLTIQRSGSDVILTWPRGTLQQANQVGGPYADVTGATSPYPVANPTGVRFFRVRM